MLQEEVQTEEESQPSVQPASLKSFRQIAEDRDSSVVVRIRHQQLLGGGESPNVLDTSSLSEDPENYDSR